MPEPATTGQLRTNIREMEIGDYIVWGSNGTNYYFSNQGIGTERPVAGASSTVLPYENTYWYGIKVAKGLIVSDRVIDHTMTWDSLNSSRRIQGVPIDTGNLIPTMTSDNTPKGNVSASSNHATYPGWKAFDKVLSTTSGWQSLIGQSSYWLAYDFGSETEVSYYAITSYTTTTRNYDPEDWNFEGWDGNQWVVLDKQVGHSFGVSHRKIFKINKVRYSKYRINILKIKASGSPAMILEFEMFDTVGTIRSLTGGTAFNNGGISSTVDNNLGSWPTTNEWDRYIVNFPSGKVQSGATLDDIFHWSGISTFCQDTPITSLGISSNRITRGGTDIKSMNTIPSATSSDTIGFRPVFEYYE